MRLTWYFIAAPLVLAVTVASSGAQMPPPIQLLSIVPAAEEVTSQFPPAPAPTTAFFFRGVKGTTYTAVFGGLPTDPAVVVGVGANISTTSFERMERVFSVTFTFDRSVVSTEREFPSDVFFLALTQGKPRTFNPQPRPPGGRPPGRDGPVAQATEECFGPLGNDGQSSSGPPLELAGSFMSTNVLEWCVIPPNETEPFFGFKLRGKAGKTGYFKKKLSPQLVALLSLLSGRTLDTSTLAIFNGNVQASRQITSTDDGGALINVEVSFGKTSTRIAPPSGAAVRPDRVSTSETSVDKSLTTSEEEDLSLAPLDFRVTGTRATLYGFAADDALSAGQTVIIQRKVGSTFRNLATTTVAADGSYTKKVSATKLFKKFKASTSAKATTTTTSTVVATIVSGATRTSREVTLQNRRRR